CANYAIDRTDRRLRSPVRWRDTPIRGQVQSLSFGTFARLTGLTLAFDLLDSATKFADPGCPREFVSIIYRQLFDRFWEFISPWGLRAIDQHGNHFDSCTQV